MSRPIRIAIAQTNPVMGDLAKNSKKIIAQMELASDNASDIVVFPEMAITGYPPEDLLLRPSFIGRVEKSLQNIASHARNTTAIIGAPVQADEKLMNAAAILRNRNWAGSVYKSELPNYGVFDEQRYFHPAQKTPILKIGDVGVSVSICEDIWVDNSLIEDHKERGATVFINISASPFRVGAIKERINIVSRLTNITGGCFVYVNLVGGQDELVFDGGSFICGIDGGVTHSLRNFENDFLIADIPTANKTINRPSIKGEIIDLGSLNFDIKGASHNVHNKIADQLPVNERIYKALTLGVKDYVEKTGFESVVIALSGGIDSALTVAIAVDALGPEKVHTVSMPSPYSSEGSVIDAQKLADNMGLEMTSLSIGDIMEGYDHTLENSFKNTDRGIAEENIQARIRGALVMALSNKFGWLVLTTGNKSEIAVGYCTLYGDMAGGFAVIKDVFKTKVYELCRWRNAQAGYDLIPNEIIDKEPSAELRPDQKDSDSLPAYEILDPILEEYIEKDRNIDEIASLGYERELVVKIAGMVDRNEYKRRQGPIGVKITSKAFGRDRRLPITNRYKES